MTAPPAPKAIPYMWRWSLFERILAVAGEAVPIGEERRALQLFNPGMDGRWATTNTLVGAVQMLLAGETARAHRHSPTAIRFIIEGTGAYTAVDGERVYMKPGDLVLTPSWAWHDHGNETDERVVWLDGLDLPLVAAGEAVFYQLYGEPQVPLSKPDNASQSRHGHGHLAPTWIHERTAASPLLIYAWGQTRAALAALREEAGSPFDGVALEYRNPDTAGPGVPTMARWVHTVRPGGR